MKSNKKKGRRQEKLKAIVDGMLDNYEGDRPLQVEFGKQPKSGGTVGSTSQIELYKTHNSLADMNIINAWHIPLYTMKSNSDEAKSSLRCIVIENRTIQTLLR